MTLQWHFVPTLLTVLIKLLLNILVADMLYNFYKHMCTRRASEHNRRIAEEQQGLVALALAAMESSLPVLIFEVGRLWGNARRSRNSIIKTVVAVIELCCSTSGSARPCVYGRGFSATFCRRFKWFGGELQGAVHQE
jgi:hypothetical protein